MRCVLCNADMVKRYERIPSYNLATDELFDLFHCKSCDLYSVSEPHKLISTYYGYKYDIDKSRKGISRVLFSMWVRSMVKMLQRNGVTLSEQSRIVDIGCGSGSLMIALRELGFRNVTGVDMSPEMVKRVEKMGFQVDVAAAEQWKVPEIFDLAVANIEHYCDPVAAARNIFLALKPGGVLSGEIPNADSIGFKIMRKNWGPIAAPVHRNLFTPKSLRVLLDKVGFERISIAPSMNSSEWAFSFDTIYRRKYEIRTVGLSTVLYRAFLLVSIPIEMFQYILGLATGHIRFTAKKPT